jgi:hypothetical protein
MSPVTVQRVCTRTVGEESLRPSTCPFASQLMNGPQESASVELHANGQPGSELLFARPTMASRGARRSRTTFALAVESRWGARQPVWSDVSAL